MILDLEIKNSPISENPKQVIDEHQNFFAK